jgi:carbon starvation protein
MDQMQQVITNVTVDGVLQALFALLTLTVIASAIPVWIKAAKSGGLPTTEVPHELSHLVAPSDFFATPAEKQAVREYEDSERELAAAGRELAGAGRPR